MKREDFPKIGTDVLYFPVLPDPTGDFPPKRTKTRSEPWQLGHGEWVVAVEGIAGGVCTSHLCMADGIRGFLGIEVQEPPKPKKTKAQRRYEAWLALDFDDVSFGDFLRDPEWAEERR